jgi:zinc resistance-associated protein
MLKSFLVGTAALALAGTTFVYAQQGPSGERHAGPNHAGPSAEDRGAFLDARVAALKAGLKLTSDQEKNWSAFEQAYRDFAKLRGEQRRAWFRERGDGERAEKSNLADRLEHRADAVVARGAALKKLADATAPLYQSLDDGQKERFQLLVRMMRPHHHEHFAFWHQHRGEGEQRQ